MSPVGVTNDFKHLKAKYGLRAGTSSKISPICSDGIARTGLDQFGKEQAMLLHAPQAH